MTTMKGKVKYLAALASLALIALSGPGRAAAEPQAFLHQVVQDLDVVGLLDTGIRVSHFVAEGTAAFPSPFCPQELADRLTALKFLSGTPRSCTVTVDGTDTICVMTSCTIGKTTISILQGGLEADIAVVVAFDNVVEAPDAVVMTGHVSVPLGGLQGVPFGVPPAIPELSGKMSTMGPQVPLFFMAGTFHPMGIIGFDGGLKLQDATFLGDSNFSATFRSPFRITQAGKPDKPVHGKQAFYLADNGDLIKIQSDEYSLGVPTLRGEVTFVGP